LSRRVCTTIYPDEDKVLTAIKRYHGDSCDSAAVRYAINRYAEIFGNKEVSINIEDLGFCPKCGNEITKDNFHSCIDETTDDQYRWIKCKCGWSAEG